MSGNSMVMEPTPTSYWRGPAEEPRRVTEVSFPASGLETSSLPDCALTALASHQLQLYRNRNHSMKTHRGSRGHLNTSLEEVRSRAPVSSNISLRSPLERSVRLRGINTRERALISGVINR